MVSFGENQGVCTVKESVQIRKCTTRYKTFMEKAKDMLVEDK